MPNATASKNISPENTIDRYLVELRTHLRRLPPEQVVDIVEEIRSHIRDAAGGAAMTEASISAALSRLGPSAELAASYVTDNLMARAQQSRMPWTILHGVFHWATLSVKGFLVFIVCLIGYGFGGSFFLTALVKPFNPKAGLWLIEQDTYSLVLGMTDRWPQGHELLGWTIIPIGLSLGGGTILLTTHFALWCIRRFRQNRAQSKFGGVGQ
jgi:hypothetical protein